LTDVEAGDSRMWHVPVSSINLVQLNRNITEEYCVNADCSGSQGAQFSADYILPLHHRFPHLPVTLQFK